MKGENVSIQIAVRQRKFDRYFSIKLAIMREDASRYDHSALFIRIQEEFTLVFCRLSAIVGSKRILDLKTPALIQ